MHKNLFCANLCISPDSGCSLETTNSCIFQILGSNPTVSMQVRAHLGPEIKFQDQYDAQNWIPIILVAKSWGF